VQGLDATQVEGYATIKTWPFAFSLNWSSRSMPSISQTGVEIEQKMLWDVEGSMEMWTVSEASQSIVQPQLGAHFTPTFLPYGTLYPSQHALPTSSIPLYAT
jgi:hypothetical protein